MNGHYRLFGVVEMPIAAYAIPTASTWSSKVSGDLFGYVEGYWCFVFGNVYTKRLDVLLGCTGQKHWHGLGGFESRHDRAELGTRRACMAL